MSSNELASKLGVSYMKIVNRIKGEGFNNFTEFRNSLVIYPNPTSDYINVSKKVDAKVFNVLGKLILSKKDINVLDVSKLQSGMYNVIFEYNNVKINKRIIKQ